MMWLVFLLLSSLEGSFILFAPTENMREPRLDRMLTPTVGCTVVISPLNLNIKALADFQMCA